MRYLWLDLETTGLDPERDEILEVGLVVTDDRLTELAMRRFLVHPTDLNWMENLDDVVLDMHLKSGLIDDLNDPFENYIYHSLIQVERCIIDVVGPFLEDGKITLAGSGVGAFDLQVIRAQMPELAQRLTYWVLDVGVIRRFLRDIVKVPISDLGPVNHRALDDVEHHLAEAQLFAFGALPTWMLAGAQ